MTRGEDWCWIPEWRGNDEHPEKERKSASHGRNGWWGRQSRWEGMKTKWQRDTRPLSAWCLHLRHQSASPHWLPTDTHRWYNSAHTLTEIHPTHRWVCCCTSRSRLSVFLTLPCTLWVEQVRFTKAPVLYIDNEALRQHLQPASWQLVMPLRKSAEGGKKCHTDCYRP